MVPGDSLDIRIGTPRGLSDIGVRGHQEPDRLQAGVNLVRWVFHESAEY